MVRPSSAPSLLYAFRENFSANLPPLGVLSVAPPWLPSFRVAPLGRFARPLHQKWALPLVVNMARAGAGWARRHPPRDSLRGACKSGRRAARLGPYRSKVTMKSKNKLGKSGKSSGRAASASKSIQTGAGAGPAPYRLGPFGPILNDTGAAPTRAAWGVLPSVAELSELAFRGRRVTDTGAGNICGAAGSGSGLSVGSGSSELRGAVMQGPLQPGKFWPSVVLEVKRPVRGRVLGHKARAVGVGLDSEQRRADDFAIWAASSAVRGLIGAVVTSERAVWSELQRVALSMAIKAAKRVHDKRGACISATSIQDAAADGIAELASRFPVGCLSARNFIGLRRVVLCRYAARAAWLSLSRWAVCGMGGARGAMGVELTTELADSLAAPAPSELFASESVARRAAVRFVYGVGLYGFKDALTSGNAGARATAIRGARVRCRVVASVILGASLFDAVAVAGLSSVAAFVNSCERAGLFPALQAARAKASWQGATVRAALVNMREHSALAAVAIKAQRAAQDGGAVVYSPPGRRRVRVAQGAARVCVPVGVRSHLGAVLAGVSFVRSAPLCRWVVPAVGAAGAGPAYLASWSRAAAARELHVGRAVFFRNVARAAVAADLAAFNRVLDRLHSEDCDLSSLRQSFGIVDKLGRVRNGSKLDATARRAGTSGKVQRGPIPLPGVVVKVATARGERKLDCAELSPRLPVVLVGARGVWLPGRGSVLVCPVRPVRVFDCDTVGGS